MKRDINVSLFTRLYFTRLNISIVQFYKGFIQEIFLINRRLSEFTFHLDKGTELILQADFYFRTV